MRKLSYLFVILMTVGILIFFQSCAKERPGTPPSISVTDPYSKQEFNVGDSISVRASISSEVELTSVKVVLVNDAGIPILVPKYFYPGTSDFELNYMYPLNSELVYGSYSLLVSASNRSFTSKVYTQVMITGPGRYFKQVIAVCQPNTLITALYSVNAEGNYENILDLDHGYTDSEISSIRQQFYFLRPSPSRLLAYEMEEWEQDFMVEASPPHPEFNSIHVADYPTLAYVNNGNGEIRGYNNVGLSAFVTPVNTDTIPLISRKHDNKIVAYCEYRGGPEKFFRQYYSETGVFRVSLNIDFTAVDFYPVDPDINLVFGNDDIGGKAYTFDVTGNVITTELSLGGGMLSSVVNTSEDAYLFAMDQAIYLYNYQKPLITTWKSGINASVLRYDDLRQLVYAAEEQKVFVFSYPDALLLQEIILPFEIKNLHIHYNR